MSRYNTLNLQGRENMKKLIAVLGMATFQLSSAATVLPTNNTLPASVAPGVTAKIFTPRKIPATPTALPARKPTTEKANSLGENAAKIKFKLNQVILSGNHVYSDQQLQALFQDKLQQDISVEELQDLVQSITNYYRNNGYILTRAILPPQRVHNGIVQVQIIEGYVDQVNILDTPKGAKPVLKKYGEKIMQSKPLQINVMEHYLRLANEIPGMEAKGILDASKTNLGGSNLNISAKQHTFSGYVAYNDYGTRYIGPHQWTANVGVNSIFLPGDTTRVTYSVPTRPQELKFYDVSYQMLIGSNGMNMTLGKNDSKTQPGYVLKPFGIRGDATTYYLLLEYPLIRTRAQNLSLDGGINYLDSGVVSTFNSPAYNDHLRTVKIGGDYDFADRLNGSNLLSLHIEQGLNIAGATNNPNSFTTSRFGGNGVFTKLLMQAMRLQSISNRLSLYLLLNGQYSFRPLLVSEQFSFGGNLQGRGYDPAEIIGDRGAAGTLELRVNFAPEKMLLKTLQPYIYYDAGVVWNMRNIANIPTKQSATSAGFGSRFIFTDHLSGNLMFTQPITRKVAALQFIGRGEAPRIFFGIIASMN